MELDIQARQSCYPEKFKINFMSNYILKLNGFNCKITSHEAHLCLNLWNAWNLPPLTFATRTMDSPVESAEQPVNNVENKEGNLVQEQKIEGSITTETQPEESADAVGQTESDDDVRYRIYLFYLFSI